MLSIDSENRMLSGPCGTITVPDDDEVTFKLAMLFEGKCEGLGASAAAKKFGYSKQRYYQLLKALEEEGAMALKSGKRGPRSNYRRTDEVIRQVIRHRFLDPDASAEVIAQKLKQRGWPIGIRSVERIVEEFGLQKKTPSVPPGRVPD